MAIPGIHLTRIGKGNFLLEPLVSLNTQNQLALLVEIISTLQQGRGKHLYYDLSELPIIDPVYYGWLDKLARACQAVNINMTCIGMMPTAAFTLSQFLTARPLFATALDVPD